MDRIHDETRAFHFPAKFIDGVRFTGDEEHLRLDPILTDDLAVPYDFVQWVRDVLLCFEGDNLRAFRCFDVGNPDRLG